jgi:hypothetical protein
VSYASPGNGSTPHLAVEFFARSAGIQLQHVPYKGGAPAITDVLGGQLPLVAVNAAEVLPHVKAGKLKVLAVMSADRASTMPDTPTIAESGYPGFEASVWYAFIAPKATPAAVVDKLNAEVRKALATAEVRQRLKRGRRRVSPRAPRSWVRWCARARALREAGERGEHQAGLTRGRSDRVETMDILVSEVGPRDGLQSIKRAMPTEVKHRWIRALAAAGLREIEVASFVPPKLLPQMADAAEVVREAVKIPGITVLALVPNMRGFQDAVAAGAPKITVTCRHPRRTAAPTSA